MLCQSVRQALSQQVLHCTCFAYKHSVNIKFSQFLFCFCLFFFPAGQLFLPSPVLKCSRAAVDVLETISSLFSAFVNNPECEILPRLCLFFFPPCFRPSSLFRPLTVYTCRGNREKRKKLHQKRHNYPKVCSQLLFFLNHYRSSTLYFSWK